MKQQNPCTCTCCWLSLSACLCYFPAENFGTIFKHYIEELPAPRYSRLLWGCAGMQCCCRTQPMGGFLLSSPARLSVAALWWEPKHVWLSAACVPLTAESWSVQGHKNSCKLPPWRVVEATSVSYAVGDIVCNLYIIYKGSRARSSHLGMAIFCPDWTLVWMRVRWWGQCFVYPPFFQVCSFLTAYISSCAPVLHSLCYFLACFAFSPISSCMNQAINHESKHARINRLSTLCIPYRQCRLWNAFCFG